MLEGGNSLGEIRGQEGKRTVQELNNVVNVGPNRNSHHGARVGAVGNPGMGSLQDGMQIACNPGHTLTTPRQDRPPSCQDLGHHPGDPQGPRGRVDEGAKVEEVGGVTMLDGEVHQFVWGYWIEKLLHIPTSTYCSHAR
eukprot:2927156-Pyramimonas_sp.AAC.1